VRQSSRALNCGLICGQSTDKNLSGFDPALINSEQWQISSSDSQRASKWCARHHLYLAFPAGIEPHL